MITCGYTVGDRVVLPQNLEPDMASPRAIVVEVQATRHTATAIAVIIPQDREPGDPDGLVEFCPLDEEYVGLPTW